MSGFTDFVSTELPKRPFTDGDGLPGQMMVRSSNPLAARQMVWVDAPVSASVPGYTAAQALGGHCAITLDAAGQAIAAGADTPAHQFVEGLSANAAAGGGTVQVVAKGVFEHLGWTFTPGLPVFLGLSGAVVQVLPPTAVFSKVLGLALSSTRIKVDLQPAIFF